MNLAEFKQALSSDATVENEKLKEQLKALQKQYQSETKSLNDIIEQLNSDCSALCNRCWALTGMTTGGAMCYHCELHQYSCPHSKSFDDKVRYAK